MLHYPFSYRLYIYPSYKSNFTAKCKNTELAYKKLTQQARKIAQTCLRRLRVLPTVTWGSFCICQWFFCLQFDMNLYLLCMSGKVLTGGKASSKQRENLVTTWWRGYSAALKALPPLPPFPLHFLRISLKNFLLSKKKKNLAITCWQGYFVAWKAVFPLPIPSSSSFLRTFLHCFFYWLFVYASYFKSYLGHFRPHEMNPLLSLSRTIDLKPFVITSW